MASVNSIYFTDNSTGFAVGGSSVSKTIDGGESWVDLPTGNSLLINFLKVNFPSQNVGYIATTHGKILKTQNSGLNWQLYSIGFDESVESISFLDDNLGYAITFQGKFLKTVNGGVNWSWINLSSNSLLDLHFNSAGTGFVVSNGGDVYKTTNGGNQWSNKNLQVALSGISFSENNKGNIIGSFGNIFQTNNSGENWSSVSPSFVSANLNHVSFLNSNVGFIVGDSGKVLKTTNAGLNWNFLNLNTKENLTYLKFIDESNGFISGNSIFKTTNGGTDWDSVSGFNSKISVEFYDPLNWILMKNSYLFRTSDGGKNWTSFYSDPFIQSFNFSNDLNTGFVVLYRNGCFGCPNENTTVLKTSNAGLNWHTVFSQDWIAYQQLKFINNDIGYLFGTRGVQKTMNAGENWSFSNSLSGVLTKAFYINSDNIAYLSNDKSIYKTKDGGLNWSYQFSTSNYQRSMCFTDYNTGYVVGYNGIILKTTNGGGTFTSVSNNANNIPSDIKLHQNFPNPFNPVTQIIFELNNYGNVELVVSDVLGREVKKQYYSNLSGGQHQIEFNGYEFPSGVYFYSLKVSDNNGKSFIQTRKMLMLK
ncbi:MAG: YCF48-related protein [bacterium]